MAETNAKESARRREAASGRNGLARTQGVVGVVRSLTEERGRPKAKEQEVLDVATDYFLKHGYEGASINAMARSSGISKESIYRYFNSKQQLFEAVIGRELVEYRRTLRQLDATLKTKELRAALVMIAETVLGLLTADRALALRRLIFDEATRSPDVGQHYYEIGPEQAYATLEHLFESHSYRSEFDVPSLARHFLALVSWRITLERECAVRAAPTVAEVSSFSSGMVDDFMKAFLRPI
jgi:TetR/AcrR family transcriptional repressor of mexJK operon